MSSIAWKIRRLKAMGLAEILYRVNQASHALLESKGLGLAGQPSPVGGGCGQPWVECISSNFDTQAVDYLARADRVLAGHFSVFAMDDVQLGFPPDWLRDPRTGTRSPLVFGKTLDYRREDIVGDIKYLWEPNRHLELVWLAQAWHLSRDERYLAGAARLLSSWFEQNPYPLGVNWTSSLEHSIRLINWSFAWHLLGGQESPLFAGTEGEALHRQWLDSVYKHCFFISRHFSRYSSANNHLLGEYAGLFVGSMTWPLWKESDRWCETARKGLEHEALLQNAEDGGNREQAIWYQHEVADMLLICGLIGRANNCTFSPDYWARLESLMEFMASFMDVEGGMPMIGDSDDALIVGLTDDKDIYRSLLATGAALFSRGDFKAKAVRFDDKSRWLLGDQGQVAFDALQNSASPLPVKRAFPTSGYYILGADFETPEEIRMIADAGPLGYLSIAAHGHADALSLCLSVGGREVLIDPGTYAYHTQQKWRDYFKGTSAHNTLRIDAVDQSVSGGNFLWNRHANAQCTQFESDENADVWSAWHDGYERLADPVRHLRSVHFDKAAGSFDVIDTVQCRQRHLVEIHWHCSEDCHVSLSDRQVTIVNGDVVVEMQMPDSSFAVETFRGQDEPPLGWISRRFDSKSPSPTIRWMGEVQSSCELRTQIRINRKAEAASK